MERFQYTTVLDHNMGYHTVYILPEIRNLNTIVTDFDKFRYNMLPMVMCASGDTFQAKVDELLSDSDIEGAKAYIENILVLGKGGYQHIDQLIIIFAGLCATVIKVNDNK